MLSKLALLFSSVMILLFFAAFGILLHDILEFRQLIEVSR